MRLWTSNDGTRCFTCDSASVCSLYEEEFEIRPASDACSMARTLRASQSDCRR